MRCQRFFNLLQTENVEDIVTIWIDFDNRFGIEASVNLFLQLFIDIFNNHSQDDMVPIEANFDEFLSKFENMLLEGNEPNNNRYYSNLSKISLLIKDIVMSNSEDANFVEYILITFNIFIEKITHINSEYSLFPGVTFLRSINLIILELKVNDLPTDQFLQTFLRILQIITNNMLKLSIYHDTFTIIAKAIIDMLHRNEDLYCHQETIQFFVKCFKVEDTEISGSILQIVAIQLNGQAKSLYLDMCMKNSVQNVLFEFIQSFTKRNVIVALKIMWKLLKNQRVPELMDIPFYAMLHSDSKVRKLSGKLFSHLSGESLIVDAVKYYLKYNENPNLLYRIVDALWNDLALLTWTDLFYIVIEHKQHKYMCCAFIEVIRLIAIRHFRNANLDELEPNDRKNLLQPLFEIILTCLSSEFVRDYSLQFKYLLNIIQSFNIEYFMEIEEEYRGLFLESLMNEILNQSDLCLLNNLLQILKAVDTDQLKYGDKIFDHLITSLENFKEPDFNENIPLQLCIAVEELEFDTNNIQFIVRIFEIIIPFPNDIEFSNLAQGCFTRIITEVFGNIVYIYKSEIGRNLHRTFNPELKLFATGLKKKLENIGSSTWVTYSNFKSMCRLLVYFPIDLSNTVICSVLNENEVEPIDNLFKHLLNVLQINSDDELYTSDMIAELCDVYEYCLYVPLCSSSFAIFAEFFKGQQQHILKPLLIKIFEHDEQFSLKNFIIATAHSFKSIILNNSLNNTKCKAIKRRLLLIIKYKTKNNFECIQFYLTEIIIKAINLYFNEDDTECLDQKKQNEIYLLLLTLATEIRSPHFKNKISPLFKLITINESVSVIADSTM